MGNYGRNSGSTLNRIKRRLFGRKKADEAQDIPDTEENGRFYKRPEKTEIRNLENNGCIRYSLDAGSDIYITASDDPFIDYEEPRSSRSGSRFLGGKVSASLPASSFSNGMPESRFTDSDFEEKTIPGMSISTEAQMAVTSSAAQAPVSAPVINFDKEPEYELEVVNDDISEKIEERLPVPPAEVERLPSTAAEVSVTELPEEVPETEVPENTEAEEIPFIAAPVPCLMLPSEEMPALISQPALPVMLSAGADSARLVAPVPCPMLPEPEMSAIDNERMMEEDEESARIAMAELPSGLYAEGTVPCAEAVASASETVTQYTGCAAQAAETSAAAEVLVSYADFCGHDFLPPITEPVRREPKAAETVSQVPEYTEIDDETGGLMMLTVPGIESDAAEYSCSDGWDSTDIPDDGMEVLGLAIDRERIRLAEEAARKEAVLSMTLSDDERAEALLMLDSLVESIVSMPEIETAPEVQISEFVKEQAETEVPDMTKIPSVSDAAEAAETYDSCENEYIPVRKPMISFVFGRNGLNSVYNLY